MADSTTDISKLKVVELKKELKSRGLSTTGDKSELVSRLQTALSKDTNSETALDSDELDSDEVLEDDDDDKNTTDLISDDLINDSLTTSTTISPTNIETSKTIPQPATRILKRKPPPVITSTESINEDKLLSPDESTPPLTKVKITAPEDSSTAAKKIVLNRVPVTAPSSAKEESKSQDTTQPKTIKLTMDPKERLELRAKRFGVPLVGDAAKEARKARFGVTTTTNTSSNPTKIHEEKAASYDVLKKRAERFGTSVSKTMIDVENKEKLEKRKQKFGFINA